MGVSLKESLRRKPPVFSDAERKAYIDQILLERFEPPTPSLSDKHSLWREAGIERDRLTNVIAHAEAGIAECRRIRDANTKKRPTFAGQFAADCERGEQPHHQTIAEAQRALAELNSVVDWDVLQAGEKEFQAAVSAARKQHNSARLANATAAVEKAREALRVAREGVTADLGPAELLRALEKVNAPERDLILAERALAAVQRAVKGK